MTVSQAKKILGGEYRKKSDKEIQLLLDQIYLLCDIASDVVLGSHGSKSKQEVIDSNKSLDQK